MTTCWLESIWTRTLSTTISTRPSGMRGLSHAGRANRPSSGSFDSGDVPERNQRGEAEHGQRGRSDEADDERSNADRAQAAKPCPEPHAGQRHEDERARRGVAEVRDRRVDEAD